MSKDRLVTMAYGLRKGRRVPLVGVRRGWNPDTEPARHMLSEFDEAAWVVRRTTSDAEAVALVVANLIGKVPVGVERIR